MNSQEIAALDATEVRKQNPRLRTWHYRRTPATDRRDAIWQRYDRSIEQWRTIERPHNKTLHRLIRMIGTQKDIEMNVRWTGFHDPDVKEA